MNSEVNLWQKYICIFHVLQINKTRPRLATDYQQKWQE